MDVVLIRHPRPVLGEGICYGSSDVELAAGFETATGSLRARLGDVADAVVFSSPLSRCRRVAEAIGAPRLDERLSELHFGKWELLPWNTIARSEFDHWSEDFVNRAPPEGESYASLSARTLAFLADAQSEGHRAIVVVTHAGVIRALLAHALGTPLEKSFALRLDFGSLTRLSVKDGRSHVHYMNC